ncbi:MAG: hypothetical protein HYZ21_08610 [Chloroflexi bacterium]|nr:hypothetical protein [Chloroflexota bacterium]
MNPNKSTETTSYKTDLFALSHPLVLLSVAVLLVNDHLLKVYAPSWLTGKLSDFAGLFFFPILLGVILNFIFKPFGIQPRTLAFLSFGFTAVWFALIKTLPVFTQLTVSFLSNLLSLPVQIICDPGDLAALVMLIPAWRLRAGVENCGEAKNKKLSYLALGLASIATLATSPSYNPIIHRLVVDGNRVYTRYDYGEDIFYSNDGGKSWVEVDFDPPSQVVEQLKTTPELPVTLCLSEHPNTCYQTGTEVILESHNGGKTWSESWAIPDGRRKFLDRNAPFRDLGPYDLAALELEGKQIIIAALGTGGVLVKTDDGPWMGYGVNIIGPLEYQSNDLDNAFDNTAGELIVLGLVAFLLLIFLVMVNVVDDEAKAYPVLKKAAAISVVTLILVFLFLSANSNISAIIFFIIGIIFVLSALTVLILAILQVLTNSTTNGKIGFVLILLAWLIAYAGFLAWAYGVIPVYGTSVGIAVVLNLLTAAWIFRQHMVDSKSDQA